MAKEISLAEADNEVVTALYQSAVNGSVQAQIFWLTNRQPNRWNKKPIIAESEDQETGVVLIPERVKQ